jgi:hypothetical protein
MCPDAFWRIAKARTEKPVEVRNIGKASLQCDGKQASFLVYCEQMGDDCAQMAYSGGCGTRVRLSCRFSANSFESAGAADAANC